MTTPRAASGLLGRHPWSGLALLMVIGTINYLDRTLPMILAEPLKHEFEFSDTAIGLLNGFGFTLVYALAGIPIARVADRGRYGIVITASLAVWSFMTALGSIAGTGWIFALSRLGVAVGEAGSTPAAHAHVSRRFAPNQRASAFALLTIATAVGPMLGLLAGGMMAQRLGWRGTMLAMGLIGLALAPIALLLLGRGDPLPLHNHRSLRELGRHLRRPSVCWLLTAFCFMSMGAYSLGGFGPAFLMRVHGLSVGETGLRLGLLNGSIGIAALMATGWLAGRMSGTSRFAGLTILLALVAITIPMSTGAILTADASFATILLGLSYGVMASYMALTVAPVHALMPVDMRAQASAALLLCSGTIGGLGPVLTGVISDTWQASMGADSLGIGLLVVPTSLLLAAGAYAMALIRLRDDRPNRDLD